jgi:hypothetical protein
VKTAQRLSSKGLTLREPPDPGRKRKSAAIGQPGEVLDIDGCLSHLSSFTGTRINHPHLRGAGITPQVRDFLTIGRPQGLHQRRETDPPDSAPVLVEIQDDLAAAIEQARTTGRYIKNCQSCAGAVRLRIAAGDDEGDATPIWRCGQRRWAAEHSSRLADLPYARQISGSDEPRWRSIA